MKHETIVMMDYTADPDDSDAFVTFGAKLPRIPGVGERLSFEGSLGGEMPVDLIMKVTSVTERFAFGDSFDEHVYVTVIEAVSSVVAAPGALLDLLLRHPVVVWVDVNDGKGVRRRPSDM